MTSPFAVKRHGHTDLFGIFLASHGVPDSFCLMHAGVGCKTKGQQHLVNHDWLRESFSRSGWSEISDIEVISGSQKKLQSAVSDWIRRRSPSILAVATAAFVELRGEDFASTLRNMDGAVGCRILYLPAAGYDGDLYRGYGSYLGALLDTLDWKGTRPQDNLVNIAGYLYDRYEMDHRANYNELNQLLGGIGLKLHRLFLSGAPYSFLQDAPEARLQVYLPYLTSPPETGRPSVRTSLPLGLRGTTSWLQRVGKAAGVRNERVEEFCDGQLRKVVPMMQPAVDRLQGLRAAVFSDTPRASALAGFLIELGIKPVLAGLTDRTLGGEKAFMESLSNQDIHSTGSINVLEDPSPGQLHKAVKEAIEESDINFIIGSSYEIQDLKPFKVPKIEIGFPSYEKHFVYPVPELGFTGALAIVQRLLDALAAIH